MPVTARAPAQTVVSFLFAQTCAGSEVSRRDGPAGRRRGRIARLGLAVLAGLALSSAPGRAESALPLSALTPLLQIGTAIEKSGIDMSLSRGQFAPDSPIPLAVAAVPPSIVEGPIVAEGPDIPESQTPRLEPPSLEPKTVPRPSRRPPIPVLTAETPAPAATPGAPVSPASAIASTSSSYRKFQTDVTAIARMRLDDAGNLKRAVQMLSAYDGNGLSRGWVAFGAETAAASKAFQSGVKSITDKRGGVSRLFGDLAQKPDQVHGIKGADKAQSDILNSVALDVAQMRALAARFLEVAYERTGAEARLAAEAGSGAKAPPLSVPARAGARGWPIMTQMLTVGARLNVDGEAAGEAPPVDGATMTTNAQSAQCMRWAKLNLEQCIAAARLNSEQAFCLSRHALEERADCLAVMLN